MCAGPGCQEIVETSAQNSALLSSGLPCSAQASPRTNNGQENIFYYFFWSKDHPQTKDAAKLPWASATAKGVFSYLPLALFLGSILPDKQSCTYSCSFHDTSEQIRMFALHNNFLSLVRNEQQGWFCIRYTHTHTTAGLCSTKPRAIKQGGFYSSRGFDCGC